MTATAQAATTFIALAVKSKSSKMPEPDEFRLRLTSIPGVEGVKPDLDRRRIHVLYDGAPSTLKKIMHALRVLNLEVSVPGYVWRSRVG